MKLVTATKVRHAQEAIVSGCPFSETLIEVLYNINKQLQMDDINVTLTKVCPIKKIALPVVTGDRGLCDSFNNNIIKKAENNIVEIKRLDLDNTIISVGKKGNNYFQHHPYIPINRFLEGGSLSITKEAQAIADDVFSLFISEDVDKILATTYIRNEPWKMGMHKRNGVIYLDVHKLPERPQSGADRRRVLPI